MSTLGTASPVASPAFGERLLAAWRDGTLIPDGADGAHSAREAQAVVTGVGESFVAWRLTPAHGERLVVRVPWRPLDDLAQPLGEEIAALGHVDPAVGPRPVAACTDPGRSPIELPYVVTSYVPGRVLAPRRWTSAHLAAHARTLAVLHRPVLPGRGRLLPGGTRAEQEAGLVRGPFSILAEVDGAFSWWREHHPEVTGEPLTAGLLDAARAVCAAAEPVAARLDSFTLAHGDLCATNVVWEDDGSGAGPVPRYIDFEWAQGDDPARDVAIIGGPVHGGPWYVPMDAEAHEAFLLAYVDAARALAPDRALDLDELRIRRDAWEAYERTAMYLHVARRAADGDPVHAAALPVLRDGLARRLSGELPESCGAGGCG